MNSGLQTQRRTPVFGFAAASIFAILLLSYSVKAMDRMARLSRN